MGRPSIRDYIPHYVNMNIIPNCPITIQDIKSAEFIWGSDLECVKGKTARQMSPTVRVENTSISVSIIQQYTNVTLSVDIMNVAGIPLIMTTSRHNIWINRQAG